MENNKIAVLFVDDEIDVLEGYKRVFYKQHAVWEIYFALSTDEAMILLDKNDIDILITDIKMPISDGIDLLYKVKAKYPHIFRFVLSGHHDEIKAFHAAGAAHQFFVKPMKHQKIVDIINESYKIKKQLKFEYITDFLNGISVLPVSTDILIELDKELNNDNVDINKVETLVYNSPALVAKIFQFVNSSFIGLKVHVNNIKRAIDLLGTKNISNILLHIFLFNNDKYSPSVLAQCKSISNHCLFTASLCLYVSKHFKCDEDTKKELYSAAILHDVGYLAFITYAKKEIVFKNVILEENIAHENDLFGINHAEAGAYLMKVWGLPDSLVRAIEFHHNPLAMNNESISSVECLYIADTIARHISNLNIIPSSDNLFEILPSLLPEFVDKFNLKNDLIEILTCIKREIND